MLKLNILQFKIGIPGDEDGKGGIYNFVTKRLCSGINSKISWTQVETGSAVQISSCV